MCFKTTETLFVFFLNTSVKDENYLFFSYFQLYSFMVKFCHFASAKFLSVMPLLFSTLNKLSGVYRETLVFLIDCSNFVRHFFV